MASRRSAFGVYRPTSIAKACSHSRHGQDKTTVVLSVSTVWTGYYSCCMLYAAYTRPFRFRYPLRISFAHSLIVRLVLLRNYCVALTFYLHSSDGATGIHLGPFIEVLGLAYMYRDCTPTNTAWFTYQRNLPVVHCTFPFLAVTESIYVRFFMYTEPLLPVCWNDKVFTIIHSG